MLIRLRRPARTLFRAAAGPRVGFGHLRRVSVLSRALGISRPMVSVRGADAALNTAEDLGMRVVSGAPVRLLARVRPEVLVIDDPSATAARPWCAAARADGIPVVSIHDLGLAFCGSDLAIDGSIVLPARKPRASRLLSGLRYAILEPGVRGARGTSRDSGRILIALGGGPRRVVAYRLARALRRADATLRIRIAAGFTAGRTLSADGITWLGPLNGLACELAACEVAVTAGGVSLYEAAALGTPTVAWPVVRGQHPTVRAFARRGLVTPVLPGARRVARVVQSVVRLRRAQQEKRSSSHPMAAPDGAGASRVAAAIAQLLGERRGRYA